MKNLPKTQNPTPPLIGQSLPFHSPHLHLSIKTELSSAPLNTFCQSTQEAVIDGELMLTGGSTMTGRQKSHGSASAQNRGFISKSKGKKEELKAHHLHVQSALLSADLILKKVFRKDGPPLGVEFDSLPSQAFHRCKKGQPGSKNSHRARQENKIALRENKTSRKCDHSCDEKRGAVKRRKVPEPMLFDYRVCNKKSAAVKKHGIGKGLMTVWRAINPDGGDFPTGVNFNGEPAPFQISGSASKKTVVQERKSQKRPPVVRRIGKVTKLQEKKIHLINRRKVEGNNGEKKKQPPKEKCELALGVRCHADLENFAMLVDDEELELRELQAGPNPLMCSAHFATNGLHSCSLCKDLLAKFPPNSVLMRPPLHMQPWGSSTELLKILFKVFHFLYTYAAMLKISSFTLDEFAQAFCDKESMLLGKVHMALLKLLLSDVEMELSRGTFPHASKNGKFLQLLHSVEHQNSILEFWKKSLNTLTWAEILRQVFVSAGFGSKRAMLLKETHNKEVNWMVKYSLSPGTLKGELFNILSEQGNNGMKISDLAKCSKIVELNLAATVNELECQICSTLSSDITLFEKISCSAYRLRFHSIAKEAEFFELDPGDSGSVDDDSEENDRYNSGDDSEHDSGTSALSKFKHGGHSRNDTNIFTVHTEIDESHPGEAWLLGLMEGEYSDLSIEEKLNMLVALVDLLGAGSSVRMEDRMAPIAECVPCINHYASGAKIKRSSLKQQKLPTPFGHSGQMLAITDTDKTSGFNPVDSSCISKCCAKAKSCSQRKDGKDMEVKNDLHPMQSIFLGSDRRYNRYWLFLGPCDEYDPGHRRIYFESSEDGHWEVIDTEEALSTLLLALDSRGMREAQLLVSLKKREASLCQRMSNILVDTEIGQLSCSGQSELNISREDSSSAVSDVDNNLCLTEVNKDFLALSTAVVLEKGSKEELQRRTWSRLQAFDAWLWDSFYSDLNAVKYSKRSYLDSLTRCESCHDLYWRDEKHCKTCHATFELDFDLEERYTVHVATCRDNIKTDIFPKHKVLSSQLQVLKAAVHAIEAVMPERALVGAWTKSTHKLWVKRLRRTSTLAELLQVLADLVDATNKESFPQCNFDMGSNSVLEEIIASFTTMPQTLSAIALWLTQLDAWVCHLKGSC